MSSSVGRPTNASLIADGIVPVSKRCKICQSGAKDEITQMMLNRATSRQIIEKFGHLFNPILTPTNIHSHKQHVNPEIAVQEDRRKAISIDVHYNEQTKALYKHRYDEAFDKEKASDALYKQRLENLLRLQHEVELLNETEKEALKEGKLLCDADQGLRRKVIQDLEVAYRGFNQDLLKHIQLDADLYTKQVSIQYMNMMKNTYLQFTQKLMDVLVKEIDDKLIRERLVEQVGDLLEGEVAPKLDPNKIAEADFEEIP